VSFYWAEAEQFSIDAIALRRVHRWLVCMAGTERHPPRCHALQGEVGRRVACSIYPSRPSPCRELQPGEDKCQRARAAHGLPPLATDVPPDLTA
jgi:Fe-S-cluster containining protein